MEEGTPLHFTLQHRLFEPFEQFRIPPTSSSSGISDSEMIGIVVGCVILEVSAGFHVGMVGEGDRLGPILVA